MAKYLITLTSFITAFIVIKLGTTNQHNRKPASVNINSIEALEKLVKSGQASTIEDILNALDPEVFEKPVLVYETKNKAQFASREYPRVILTMKNGTTMAFSTAPKEKGYQQLEVFEYNFKKKEFQTASFDFSKRPSAEIQHNPKACLACHGDSRNRFRPKVDPYPSWAGWYGSRGFNVYMPEAEVEDFEKLKANLNRNKRLSYLAAIQGYDLEKQHNAIIEFQARTNHLIRKSLLHDLKNTKQLEDFIPALLSSTSASDNPVTKWGSLSSEHFKLHQTDLDFINFLPPTIGREEAYQKYKEFYSDYIENTLSYISAQEREHNRLNKRFEAYPQMAGKDFYTALDLNKIKQLTQISFILNLMGLDHQDYSIAVVKGKNVFSSPDKNFMIMSLGIILKEFADKNPQFKDMFKYFSLPQGKFSNVNLQTANFKDSDRINDVFKTLHKASPSSFNFPEVQSSIDIRSYYNKTNSQKELDRLKSIPREIDPSPSLFLDQPKAKPKGFMQNCAMALKFLFG